MFESGKVLYGRLPDHKQLVARRSRRRKTAVTAEVHSHLVPAQCLADWEAARWESLKQRLRDQGANMIGGGCADSLLMGADGDANHPIIRDRQCISSRTLQISTSWPRLCSESVSVGQTIHRAAVSAANESFNRIGRLSRVMQQARAVRQTRLRAFVPEESRPPTARRRGPSGTWRKSCHRSRCCWPR